MFTSLWRVCMVAVEMLFLRVLGGMVSSLTMGDDIEI